VGYSSVDVSLQWEGISASSSAVVATPPEIYHSSSGQESVTVSSIEGSIHHSVFSLGVGELPFISLRITLRHSVCSLIIVQLLTPVLFASTSLYATFTSTSRDGGGAVAVLGVNCMLLCLAVVGAEASALQVLLTAVHLFAVAVSLKRVGREINEKVI